MDSAYQGKGIGGELLKHLLDKLDGQGDICYLETAKKANVKIYKRYGFIVAHKERICGDGPLMRYMMVCFSFLFSLFFI